MPRLSTRPLLALLLCCSLACPATPAQNPPQSLTRQDELRAVVKPDPKEAKKLADIGARQEAAGDYEGALEAYEEAARYAPFDVTIVSKAAALRSRLVRGYVDDGERLAVEGNLGAAAEAFAFALHVDPTNAVLMADKSDVALLYWTAAAWASAISLSKDNPELVGQIPQMEALIDRALALDESFGNGSIHTFLISYEMSRSLASGDPAVRARKHFDRAMVLSNGTDASPLVAFAESVSIQKQDVKQFESLLNQALAVNPDADPEKRLQNLVMQRRARWLLSRKSELFLVE